MTITQALSILIFIFVFLLIGVARARVVSDASMFMSVALFPTTTVMTLLSALLYGMSPTKRERARAYRGS